MDVTQYNRVQTYAKAMHISSTSTDVEFYREFTHTAPLPGITITVLCNSFIPELVLSLSHKTKHQGEDNTSHPPLSSYARKRSIITHLTKSYLYDIPNNFSIKFLYQLNDMILIYNAAAR